MRDSRVKNDVGGWVDGCVRACVRVALGAASVRFSLATARIGLDADSRKVDGRTIDGRRREETRQRTCIRHGWRTTER